jgi:hypothetical protein
MTMIRPEIEELERLGPLPADDDDYPGIDRRLFDVEHLLAVVDPPVTVEEARVLAALFPRDGGTCYGLAWSLLHLIETLGVDDGLREVVPGVDSAQWREMFEQRLENAEDPRRPR